MIHNAAVAILLFLFYTEYADAMCGDTLVRQNNRTCPERAICGAKFEQDRYLKNGTIICVETRTHNNCLCPGGTVCPTSNPDHLLYSSRRHKQFVCRPTCTLPWCGNVRASRMPGQMDGRTNGRRNESRPIIAQTTILFAEEFGHESYVRMNCRCLGHHHPSSSRGHHVAVQYIPPLNSPINIRNDPFHYACSGTSEELQRTDPCDD